MQVLQFLTTSPRTEGFYFFCIFKNGMKFFLFGFLIKHYQVIVELKTIVNQIVALF